MGERVANPGPTCWHLGRSLWSLKPWRIRIGPVPGPEVLVLVRGPECQTNKKRLRWQKKVCSHALLWSLTLYRCPWNTWFTLALSRCLGKTFRYKVQDREIVLSCLVVNLFQNQILKYLTHSIDAQMESLHIEPLRGCGQSYQRQRLCCCGQSPSAHRCSFAHLGKRFRCGPCAVTRLQCWGSMAIPSPERTPVHAGVMIERTFF